MYEHICRFCLKTICGDFQIIGEAFRCILDKLLLQLNLDISKDAIMCVECVKKLQISFNFKSTCIHSKARLLLLSDFEDEVSLDLNKIQNMNAELVSVSKDQDICRFCTKPTGEAANLLLLNESMENMYILDMLQRHLPELNLNNTEALLTCKTCVESLQSLLGFITNCLHVEENIKKFIEMHGTDDNGQIGLCDVQQFVFNLTLNYEVGSGDVNLVGVGCDVKEVGIFVLAEPETKSEDDIDGLELNIEHAETGINPDQNDCETFHISLFLPEAYEDKSDASVFKCEVYKCDKCSFKTSTKKDLKKHMIAHNDESQITMYKCDICSFQTKHKSNLKSHNMRSHKDASEITMYECESCSFTTKYKRNMERHRATHKVINLECNTFKITMFKCDFCSYETRHKHYLKTHMLKHKLPSELTVHQCDVCSYKTTRGKERLRQHMIVHKDASEVATYHCEFCSFNSKYKNSYERHLLTHKNPSEVPMYRCIRFESCSFQTKHKNNLKAHNMRFHRDAF